MKNKVILISIDGMRPDGLLQCGNPFVEELMKKAMDAGVKIIACSMSMDVMGIREEELIDGVEIGGVGTYLGEAEEANVNLFI